MKSTHPLASVSVPWESPEVSSNFSYRGLLNSNYKRQIKENSQSNSSNSLYSLKQRIKTNQHRFASVAGTVLKVSVFVIAYLIAFA